MKKIRQNKKRQQRAHMKSSTKILLYSITGILLLAIIALVTIESMADGIRVTNKSNEKLEYVKAFFVDMEGRVTEDELLFENIESGDKFELPIEKIDLLYRQANLEVRFKFENQDEMFVDAGYFNDIFDGYITISFSNMDDDNILLKIRAKTGIISSPYIMCDEEHNINMVTGTVEE